MNFSLIFKVVGLLGLFILAILLYITNLAAEGSFLMEYRFNLIVLFVMIFLVHYIYLAVVACKQGQWWWAAFLFIAPVPVYWVFFGWTLINERLATLRESS